MSTERRAPLPNWVHIATLIAVAVTTLITVFSTAMTEYRFARYYNVIKDMEIELKRTEVFRTTSESFTVQGELLGASVYALDDKTLMPIAPLVIHITNEGDVPLDVTEVGFEIFQAHLSDVCRLADGRTLRPGTTIKHDADEKGEATDGGFTGFIDCDSPKWLSKTKSAKQISKGGGRIMPGQTRVEKFHVVVPGYGGSTVGKVEAIVSTTKSKQRWYGFTDPSFCAAGPTESVVPEPGTAPVP